MAVRVAGDAGTPVVVSDPDGTISQSFKAAARALAAGHP